MVVKAEAVTRASDLDVPGLFGELTAEFGKDLLSRKASRALNSIHRPDRDQMIRKTGLGFASPGRP